MILYKRLLSAVDSMDSMDNTNPWVELYKRAETIEYSGLVVAHLAADPGIMQHTLYITTIHNTLHNGRHDGGDGAHHQHGGSGEEVRAHRHRRQHAHGPQVLGVYNIYLDLDNMYNVLYVLCSPGRLTCS